jgi:DNA recombination protein RmuC
MKTIGKKCCERKRRSKKMVTVTTVTFVLGGFALGFVTAFVLALMKAFSWKKKIWGLEQEKTLLEFKIDQERKRYQEELSLLKETMAGQKEQFHHLQDLSKNHFEVLAQKILEEKSQTFSQATQAQLVQLLIPFREQITHFEGLFLERLNQETQERFRLKGEIERLIQVHDRVVTQTENLSRALKGDNKFQGSWGELVLESLLEASGLRLGQEYLIQESYRSESGALLRPDVVVKLPQNRHIIIDSKVSLKAFEQIQSLETLEEGNTTALVQDHIKSIEAHIQGLGNKAYQKLPDLQSPDFVFLFIPIETAWLMALKIKPQLGSWAWEKGVAVVTASTLFTSLKMVAHLWLLEKQNKNTQQIAKEAGALYDKFVGFFDEFEKIGIELSQLQEAYDKTKNRLMTGKGNIVTKIENLKVLGAKASKQIKSEYLDSEESP